MENEKDFEILKAIPKEMGGNGISTIQEEINIEKYLIEFETV